MKTDTSTTLSKRLSLVNNKHYIYAESNEKLLERICNMNVFHFLTANHTMSSQEAIEILDSYNLKSSASNPYQNQTIGAFIVKVYDAYRQKYQHAHTSLTGEALPDTQIDPDAAIQALMQVFLNERNH